MRALGLRGAGYRIAVCVLLAVATVLVWLLGAACQPGQAVEFENATSQPVTVYQGGILALRLDPREVEQPVGFFPEDWRPEIEVVAEDGRVLLRDKITWDEVAQMKYRIVITDPATAASSEAVLTEQPAPTSAEPTPIWPTPPPASCWGKAPQSPLAPDAPTNLSAELVSSLWALEGQLVRLQWDESADEVRCYVIERKVNGGDWSVYEGGWAPGLGPVAVDDAPGEVGVHCYRVSNGNEEGRSAYSNEACVDVEVVPVVATPTPPVTPEPPPGWTPPPSPTPFPWPCNPTDDPPYSELAPSAPTDLAAIAVQYPGMQLGYWVELLWRLDATDPLCYIVQRLGNDGAWRTYGGYTGLGFIWADGEPWLGVRCYRVAVANEHGRSAWSNEACATGPAVVPTPVPQPPPPTPTLTPTPEEQPQLPGPDRFSAPEATQTPLP